jgi:hypothetical protein
VATPSYCFGVGPYGANHGDRGAPRGSANPSGRATVDLAGELDLTGQASASAGKTTKVLYLETSFASRLALPESPELNSAMK